MDKMRAAYTRVMAQAIPTCDGCHGPLEVKVYHDGERQLTNEVGLVLGGGYGSFIDSIVGGEYGYVFCEACAARLCRTFGLSAPLREHHTSTVCGCPDRGPLDAQGFPLPCGHTDCAAD